MKLNPQTSIFFIWFLKKICSATISPKQWQLSTTIPFQIIEQCVSMVVFLKGPQQALSSKPYIYHYIYNWNVIDIFYFII